MVQMINAITQNCTTIMELVHHFPDKQHGIECEKCITFGDKVVDEFENLVRSTYKCCTLVIPVSHDITM